MTGPPDSTIAISSSLSQTPAGHGASVIAQCGLCKTQQKSATKTKSAKSMRCREKSTDANKKVLHYNRLSPHTAFNSPMCPFLPLPYSSAMKLLPSNPAKGSGKACPMTKIQLFMF